VVNKIFHKPAVDALAVETLLSSANVNNVDLNIDAITTDPYAVAQALLQYFERLPSPIVPVKLLPQFEKLYGVPVTEQAVPDALHEAVNQLDEPAFQVLSFLFRFLSEFAEQQGETRMEAVDLAGKFAPMIFRSNSRVNTATEGMLRYYSFVFSKKKAGRTFGITKIKADTAKQDHDTSGYVDNRFDYMARGYS